jgi:hypothetical protein
MRRSDTADPRLGHVSTVLRGDEKDWSRLKNTIVECFAVRDFEESGPELAEVLNAARAIAYKAAKGLKV